MVKAHKSAGRRSAHSHRPQSGDQAEEERPQQNPQQDPQQDPQQQPQQQQQQQPQQPQQPRQQQQQEQEDEDNVAPPAPSTPAQSPASAKGSPPPPPSPCGDQDDSPQHDRSPQSQNKPLWKPIPPLVPESLSHTRDQSCQTEESCTGNHGQNTGGCVEPGDPPLLQQPLQTSKSGIQQIIECFRSGTSQLKHMLLREVDTIFECKLCRSLFRGLPNLITHKEYYCLSQLPEPDGPPGDDRQSVAVKDLLDAIYPRSDRSDYVVRLEPIQTTNKAVFQYIATEEELARYPSHTPSARESPVAWEGEAVESADNNQPSQPGGGGGPEGHSSPAANQAAKRWEAEEEPKDEQAAHEDEGSTSGVDDVTISCCLCGQDFNSRRSIRRHCRKMHQTKLEELRKFTETRTVPTSLLSMVKGKHLGRKEKYSGRPKTLSSPTGKFCPVCLKTFATKANVRRHFDEVHRGLRRDNMSPGAASRPGQLFLEATPPKKNHSSSNGGGGASSSSNASPTRSHAAKSTPATSKTPLAQNQTKTQTQPQSAAAPASTAACRCTLCKRNYSSQLMLKRHMRIVHKVYSVKSNRTTAAPSPSAPAASNSSGSGGGGNTTSSGPSNNVRVKEEAAESSDDKEEEEEEEEGEEEMDSSPAPSPSGSSSATNKSAPAAAATGGSHKVKEEEPPSSPKTSLRAAAGATTGAGAAATAPKMTKLSVGFDFTQLFCKLCKRQFSSRQNLTKHIELHTDGNDIFIKFYRCPLCRYESRRKRDVLRHVTVVHKKSSSYLAKIMPKLESRAVKRLAEVVLNSANGGNKRTGGGSGKEEVNGRQASSSSTSSSSPSPPVTRKQQDCSSGPAPSSSSSSSSTTTQPPPPPPATRKHQEAPSTPAAATAAATPPVTRKQERHQSHQRRATSPPLTRRSEKHMHQRNSSSSSSSSAAMPNTRRHDADSGSTGSTSTEVRVTKNFSLHACDQCGRAFAKKLYLESHKRSHRNTPPNKRKGVSTRSKSLAW